MACTVCWRQCAPTLQSRCGADFVFPPQVDIRLGGGQDIGKEGLARRPFVARPYAHSAHYVSLVLITTAQKGSSRWGLSAATGRSIASPPSKAALQNFAMVPGGLQGPGTLLFWSSPF
jgi:hypothetical protein